MGKYFISFTIKETIILVVSGMFFVVFCFWWRHHFVGHWYSCFWMPLPKAFKAMVDSSLSTSFLTCTWQPSQSSRTRYGLELRISWMLGRNSTAKPHQPGISLCSVLMSIKMETLVKFSFAEAPEYYLIILTLGVWFLVRQRLNCIRLLKSLDISYH